MISDWWTAAHESLSEANYSTNVTENVPFASCTRSIPVPKRKGNQSGVY